MKLHHVGIVVRDLTSYGEAHSRTLGSIVESPIFLDPLQKVRVQFWRDDTGSLIELIEPTGPDSPVWRESHKRGGGPSHLCYETHDIEASIQQSILDGGMIAREIAPAVAFGGRRVVFMYFLELGLIEFVETPA